MASSPQNHGPSTTPGILPSTHSSSTSNTHTPSKTSHGLSVAIPSSIYPLLASPAPSKGTPAATPAGKANQAAPASATSSSSSSAAEEGAQQIPSTPSLHTTVPGLMSPLAAHAALNSISMGSASASSSSSMALGGAASPVPSASNGPSPAQYTSPPPSAPVWGPLPAPVLNPAAASSTPLVTPVAASRAARPAPPRSARGPGSGSANPMDTLDLLVGVAMQSASKAPTPTSGVKRSRSKSTDGSSVPKRSRKRATPTTTARRGPLNFTSPTAAGSGASSSASAGSSASSPSTTTTTTTTTATAKATAKALSPSVAGAASPRASGSVPSTPKGGQAGLGKVRDGGVSKRGRPRGSFKPTEGEAATDNAVPREPQRIVLYPYSKLTREQQKAQHRMTSALKTADAEAILTDPNHGGMTLVDPPDQSEHYIVGQKVLCTAFIPYRHPRLHISNIISTSAGDGRTTTAFIPNVTVESWLDVQPANSGTAVELETPLILQGARVTRRHLKLNGVMLMEAHLSCGSKQVQSLIPILRHLNRCETSARTLEASPPKGPATPRTPKKAATTKKTPSPKSGGKKARAPATPGASTPSAASSAAAAAAAAVAVASPRPSAASSVATLLAAVEVEERRSPKTSPVSSVPAAASSSAAAASSSSSSSSSTSAAAEAPSGPESAGESEPAALSSPATTTTTSSST